MSILNKMISVLLLILMCQRALAKETARNTLWSRQEITSKQKRLEPVHLVYEYSQDHFKRTNFSGISYL